MFLISKNGFQGRDRLGHLQMQYFEYIFWVRQQDAPGNRGSCPLTVERGKIVLAEFGYGGAMWPSFPTAITKGTKPSRAAWFLNEKCCPRFIGKVCSKGANS
jgi:hypothetical protein